jgi:hypothetical protein
VEKWLSISLRQKADIIDISPLSYCFCEKVLDILLDQQRDVVVYLGLDILPIRSLESQRGR